MTAVDDRADWLAWRRSGIGASDVASIARIPGAFSTRWELWAERVGLVSRDDAQDEDELLRWGHDIEPVAARRFHEETGLYAVGEQSWCEHPEHAWMHATPDAFVCESPDSAIGDALGTLELKFDKTWSPWDEVPPHYQAQAQWQMAVTGMPRTWFGVVHGWRFRVYEFERDQADIDWLVEVAEQFWTVNLLQGVPPDVDGLDGTTRALNRAWRGDSDLAGSIDQLGADVARWDELKAQIGRLENDLAEVTNRIKAHMGEATVATIDGRPAFTWRGSPRRHVDLDGLRAAAPDLVAEFTTTDTVRRFLRAATKES